MAEKNEIYNVKSPARHEKRANEIYLSRVYDAPVKAVWDAWNDPDQAAQWWGPRGWSIKTHSKDTRAGGKWIYDMMGPAGEFFANVTLYHEVIPLKRLVYDHGGGEDRPPLFRVLVTFEELPGGKTHMEMTMALATDEAAAQTKKFIRLANGNSTWDRLAEHLDTSHEKFVFNRVVVAPIARVYDMFATPSQFSRWLAPTGFTMEFQSADFRVGGHSSWKMTDGAGVAMHGSFTHRELSPVTRLVYEQDFRESNGKVSRHPFLPLWPESMTAVVTLASEDATSTRVTIEWSPSASASPAELAAFRAEKTGMTTGWNGSFDKLDSLL